MDKHLNQVDHLLEAPDKTRVEKISGRTRKVSLIVGLVVCAAILALVTGLLVWHFHLRRDIRVKRVYVGSIAIKDMLFKTEYEDPRSSEFQKMASLIVKELKLLYSSYSVLNRYLRTSRIQAFSDGDDNGIVAYYHSEFEIPVSQQASLDEAIKTLEPSEDKMLEVKGRMTFYPKSSMSISHILSGALDPRMGRALVSEKATTKIRITGEGGLLLSPGFPDTPYPSNLSQQWLLQADPRHRVKLDFHTLILEDDCQHDFLKIYDSLVPIELCALTEQCGYPQKSLSFLSSGNVMLLTLVTNQEKNFPGFRAFYSQVPLDSGECGERLLGEKGSFSSPFFPSNYPPKASCQWDIQVSKERFIKLEFEKFAVGNQSEECLHDYLEVDQDRFCGRKLKSSFIIIKSSKATVTFQSGSSYVDQGFLIRYESFIPSDPCPKQFRCSSNLCINTTLQCDGWNDCGDNSDEMSCICRKSYIKCKNGLCKPQMWTCDGYNDCGDGTDEENCNRCKDGGFLCRNGRCISQSLKCNGENDCGDGSDESQCKRSLVLGCSEFTFRCANGRCISKINPECDEEQDCEDGSDEADCSCGIVPFRSSRVVGGVVSKEGEWPWQVSLHFKGEGHVCGASVLNNRWLLTAAHCVQDSQVKRYSEAHHWEALLGLHVQGQTNEWTVKRRVRRIIAHEDFSYETYDNDIALMELDADVRLNQYIWPICLPSPAHDFPAGQEAWISGWGATSEGGFREKFLQKAAVRIVNTTVCSSLMEDQITDRMLCAGVLEGGVDACQGDSGGPLTVQKNRDERAFLAGVVSWGEGCGQKNKAGIYTRVTKFRSWIKENCGL
uniref:Suppression of tumorigenicity 14b n=1 Tax=Oryzias latipes TaxID=8090 RepID=A0A3P9I1T8_ORYLA